MAITEKMYARLLGMTKEGSINLLVASLEEMQGYNGQSLTSAIAKTAGGKPTKNGWLMPSQKKMRDDWAEQYPLIGLTT